MPKQHTGAAVLFLILAILMTWPLVPNLNRAVADRGDPYINTWILDWDWYATFHRPLKLFDANAFYPNRYSLAYSENLYGIALLLFPFRAIGIGPIAAHNLAILAGFAFSGFAAYLLGRLITGSAAAGVVCGAFYAFVPFRFTHLSHVQHVWGGTLALMLTALLWYVERPIWRRAALFASAFLFNGLCNVHWLLFGTIAIAVTVAIVQAPILRLAVCTAIAIALLVAFLFPYFEAARLYGMRRSWSETKAFSATPSDWLVSSDRNRMYTPLQDSSIDPERWLFPGALSILLAAVGFLSRDGRALKIAATWIAIGFVGSLGLHTIFYRFLFSWVPGFRAIRVPARWAAISYIGLAILIAVAASILATKRAWIYIVLTALFIIELRAAPILWYITATDDRPVERWVAANNPRGIIELPTLPLSEYAVMLRSTVHHKPMVNGVSGFTPPEYERIRRMLDEWSVDLLPQLKRLGVSHVIVHADGFDLPGRNWLRRSVDKRDLAFIRRFDGGIRGDWLFATVGTPRPSPDLDAMLRGEPTPNENTFGDFMSPSSGNTVTNNTQIFGYAFSPAGIRQVNLLVNNGTIRLPTELLTDPSLMKIFPWYPATPKPKWYARFSTRPSGVWQHTDIQPEVIDGRGNRMLLEDRRVEWP
ncbi:MAG: hypothetical protein M3041_16635 [Acidobacteriota bacterium]|nr:hypothetical protein [Acidobacteriota bacterium]